MATERPTKAAVFEMLEDRRGNHFGRMHQQMLIADEWLHADEEPSPIIRYINYGFPEGHQWEIFPYAWTSVNRGVNQEYTAQVPQVTYELPKKRHDSEAAKKKQEAMQEWLQGTLYNIATTHAQNPILDMLYQQLGLGLGALSYPRSYEGLQEEPQHGRGTPEEQEAWESWEEQRERYLPWRVDSMHPTWVFLDPHHDPPRDYIIERPVSLAAMAERYPKLGLDGSQGGATTAKFVEYVSADWYGCWVNGEPVTEHEEADEEGIAPNGLRHPWYQPAWSGLGKKDNAGAWERIGVGLVQRGIGLFKAMTTNDNWLSLIKRLMIPKYIAKSTTKEKAEEETADFDPGSPSVTSLSNDTSLDVLDTLPIPPALLAELREKPQQLEQLFGYGVLSGEFESEPASKQATRLEQARGPYRTPKKNAEQAVANMLYDMLRDLKFEADLRDGVTVRWTEGKGKAARKRSAMLKPDDIILGGKVSVDFSPETPEDKAFKAANATEKQKAGWWSVERAMKEGGEIDDPTEELAQIQADAVMQGEAMLSFLSNVAIQRLTARFQAMGLLPPPMLVMPPGPDGGASPVAAPSPPEVEPVPAPGVPPQQPPMLGSDRAAMQEMRSNFQPPTPVRSGGSY